jgi:hydrogenase maturation factor
MTTGYVLASDRHNARMEYMAETVMAENPVATILLTMLANAHSLDQWSLVERMFALSDLDANEAESLLDDVATVSEQADIGDASFYQWEESCDSLRDYMTGV